MRFRITLLFLFLAVASFAQTRIGSRPAFSFSAPKTYEIASIGVTGTENLDPNAIKLLSGLTVGQEIDVPGDETAEALRKLWKQDLFSDVQLYAQRIEGKKIFLEIKVKERPRLSRFRLPGATKSEADDIRERINLFKEKIVTENLIISTQNKVYQFYAEKGFYNAEINVVQEEDSIFKNHVILTINVDKNKKVKIQNIVVEGNDQFSPYKIKRLMKETKEKSVFKPFADLDTLGRNIVRNLFRNRQQIPYSALNYVKDHIKLRIFKGSKYLPENFEGDKELIIAKYNQMGYRDARIVEEKIYPSGKHTVDIALRFEEGYPYYFRDIEWIGNTKYDSERLSSILGIKRGDIYDPLKLEARLYLDPNGGDVTSLYMDDGYLFFQLDPVEILSANDSIDLEIRMYEGEQARIRNVSVSGNSKTNDYVVLRELRTKPGELFSRADIIRSQRELSILGFFDPESMNVIPTPDPASATVDIEYVVEERPNDQLTLQGGAGGGLVILTLGVQFNNFSTKNLFKPKQWNGPLPSGDGQKLGVNINTNGRQYQAFDISFTEPWLGGKKPISLTVGGFYSIFTDGSARARENPNSQYFERLGGSVQLGKRLTWPDNYFTLISEASFQQFRLQNFGNQFIFGTGLAYNAFLRFKLIRSSINDNIFPNEGSEISFSAQITPPYSLFSTRDYSTLNDQERYRWLEYHKWKFTAAFYNKLVEKFVLYTRIGFGAIGLYNRDIGPAPFERFYLGGDPFGANGAVNGLDSREIISLRGYGAANLSPRSGATLINKYTMELRYPFSTNPNATFYGLAFAEAGNSWLDFDGYNPLQIYKSTGLGVRIFLPMFGLLGVDWGYRLDDVDRGAEFPPFDNQRSRFHFTLGYSFGEL